MTPSRARPVLAALLAFVAFLAAGEWAARRWLQTPAGFLPTSRLGIRAEPHARYISPSEGYSVRTTNAFGFFDDDTLPVRPHRRVLLLGDSFAEGLQLPAEQTFASVAERALPGTEILNAAQSGRFPLYYAAVLPALDSIFHPDAVVIQINDGDLDEMGMTSRSVETMAELENSAREVARDGANPPRGWLRSILHECVLLKYIHGRIERLAVQERTRWRKKWHPGTETSVYEREGTIPPGAPAEFDSLYTVMRARNPRLVLVYMPHVRYFDRPVRVLYPLRRAFYRDFAARHGAVLVDPSDSLIAEYQRTGQPLQGFANSVAGEGHMNALGHAVVGRMLADELRRELP